MKSDCDLQEFSKNPQSSVARDRRAFLRSGLFGGSAAALVVTGCVQRERAPAVQAQAPAQPPTPAPAAATAPTAATTPTAAPAPAAAAADANALPDGLLPRNFIVHNLEPLALETRRDRFGSGVITPLSLFFVRNNLPMPSAEIVRRPDDWAVTIEGVAQPRPVTVRELKTWGLDTVATVLQCSGNGRQFFGHKASGSQWGVGAAGCAVWSGVRLRTVVERLGGALDDLPFLTSTGGEVLPEGVEASSVIVERSIPRAKALDDCLLAWEMNGAPIPITHGGPLRLIVPGYYGCNQIKYVKRVAFTAAQTDAHIMRKGYRFRPIGVGGAADQPSMWQMGVKSWINQPSGMHPVSSGPLQIHGVAFSGGNGVRGVEGSLDGGASWRAAELIGPDLGPAAWRQFKLTAEFSAGAHHLLCRATDDAGVVQDELRVENDRGYGHNGWRDHGVHIEVVDGPVIIADETESAAKVAKAPAPGTVALSDDSKAGRALFVADAAPPCATCHTLAEADAKGVVGPNLNALAPTEAQIVNAVTKGVGAMPNYAESLSTTQIKQLAAYLRSVVR